MWDLQCAQSRSVHCAHKCEMGLSVSKQWQQWPDQKKKGPGKILWKCYQQWDHLGWGVVTAGLPWCKQFKSISCPTYPLSKLQKVQNSTATLILGNPRSAHISVFFFGLLLSRESKTKYFALTWRSLIRPPSTSDTFFTFAVFLSSSVLLQTPKRSEYHPSTLSLVVSTLFNRAPTTRNQFTVSVCHAFSVSSFRSSWKTVLIWHFCFFSSSVERCMCASVCVSASVNVYMCICLYIPVFEYLPL